MIVIHDTSRESNGYKFDMIDSDSREIVKVFATRDALAAAIVMTKSSREFDAPLFEIARKKFERGHRERDGTILIKGEDFAT